jgi:phosphoenolpyruvate-protein kinase (PTS system EI component)
MGGDPRYIPRLLECGLTSLSVSPLALARTKAAIARYPAGTD